MRFKSCRDNNTHLELSLSAWFLGEKCEKLKLCRIESGTTINHSMMSAFTQPIEAVHAWCWPFKPCFVKAVGFHNTAVFEIWFRWEHDRVWAHYWLAQIKFTIKRNQLSSTSIKQASEADRLRGIVFTNKSPSSFPNPKCKISVLTEIVLICLLIRITAKRNKNNIAMPKNKNGI